MVFIGCIRPPCNRSVAVFFHVGPYSFPWFQEEHISLVFHLKYFLFFFVNIAHLIFFKQSSSKWSGSFSLPFGTCLSLCIGFPLVSLFLAFEAIQERWDLLLYSLKTIADLHLFGSMGLIKFKDVSVGLDSLFAFSKGDSSYIYVFPGLMLSPLL